MPILFRSASYNSATGECRISDMDRHTVAGTSAFQESQDDEYLENNCVDDPVKLCDFQLLENRIMKTVDSVYQVRSSLLLFVPNTLVRFCNGISIKLILNGVAIVAFSLYYFGCLSFRTFLCTTDDSCFMG